jgi:hypothetical protein
LVTGVDSPVSTVESRRNGVPRPAPEVQLTGQAVARTDRHDPERDVVESQRGPDFVDRAVTAPDEHRPNASVHQAGGELECMSCALGDKYLGSGP